MKALFSLLTLITLTVSPLAQSAQYYSTGQLAFEDRLNVADFDVNDTVIQLKAIFQDSGGAGTNLEEILILISPVAAGASDNIQLYFDHRFLPGTCSVAGFADGKSCEDQPGAVWTIDPNITITLHRQGGTDDLVVDKNYLIYDSVSAMFASCAKSSMVNTTGKDCSEEPVAITIENPGFSYTSGPHLTNDSSTVLNSNTNLPGTVTPLSDNRLDFSKMFYVNNVTQGDKVKYDTPGAVIFHSPINSGFPSEYNHWYDAFDVNGKSGFDGTAMYLLTNCDPRLGPNPANCDNALADWFGGGVQGPGTYGLDRTALPGALAVTDDIVTPDFNIAQPDNGSALGSMVWKGTRWEPSIIDPVSGQMQLFHIEQYRTEQSGVAHGIAHTDALKERGICYIIGCAGGGPGPGPGGGGSILAPPVVSLFVSYTMGSIHDLTISAKNLMLDRVSESPDQYGLAMKPLGMGAQPYSYSLVGQVDTSDVCPSSPTDPLVSNVVMLTSNSLLDGAASAGNYKGHPLTVLTNTDEFFPWSFSGQRITHGGSLSTYYQVDPSSIVGQGVPAANDGLAFENENHWGSAGESYYMNFNTFSDRDASLDSALGTGVAVMPPSGCFGLSESSCNSEPACQWNAPNCNEASNALSAGTFNGNKYCVYSVISDVAQGSVVNTLDVINNATESVVSEPTSVQAQVVLTDTSGAPCPAGSENVDMGDPNSLCISYTGEVAGEVDTYEDSWSGDTLMSKWDIPYALQ